MPVPPEIPIVDPSSPHFGDLLLIESKNTTTGAYDLLPKGTPHPNAGKYPGYVLVLEKPFPGDEKWMQRYYAADPTAENTYNLAQQSFDGEDAGKEVFVRHYLVRRDEYISSNIPAKGSVLSGVVGVRVTAGGSGYDTTTTVSFSGGAGSGAAASPIIFRGAVVGIYVTAEGTGYTSAPTVTITGPAGSAGATATSRIQPTDAYLISEQANRMEGAPEDGLYLKITRIYHTLPGATLTTTKVGEQGAIETTTVQRRLTGTTTATGGYLVLGDTVRAESTVVDVRERTVIDDWPILTEYDQDPEMQSLITRTYEVVDATAVTNSAAAGDLNAGYIQSGVIREFRKLDKWRSLKVETTYSTPSSYSEQRFMAYAFETVLLDFAWAEDCGTFIEAEWGKSIMVEARLAVSFGPRKTIGKTGNDFVAFRPWTKTFRYGGFSVSDVLIDAGCVEFTGTCVGSIPIPASVPTATAYLALFNNTEQIVSGESVLWKAGIYKTSVLYVMFPTKPSADLGEC